MEGRSTTVEYNCNTVSLCQCLKMQEWKMREWKYRHETARKGRGGKCRSKNACRNL